jgi:hypothetical protein
MGDQVHHIHTPVHDRRAATQGASALAHAAPAPAHGTTLRLDRTAALIQGTDGRIFAITAGANVFSRRQRGPSHGACARE